MDRIYEDQEDADEIIGCFKGKCATILFKKIVRDGSDTDIPLITLFKKPKEIKRKKAQKKIHIEYDVFYQELHIKKETKQGTEYVTKYMDGMTVVSERKFFIPTKGGG